VTARSPRLPSEERRMSCSISAVVTDLDDLTLRGEGRAEDLIRVRPADAVVEDNRK